MPRTKKLPQTVLVSVPTDAIQVPDVEPAERLTPAQHEAWALWAREVINGEDVEAEVDPDVFIAFLQWRKLMNGRAFCLVPMNSAEFRASLAGRLIPADRRRIVELASLTMVEAMTLPFPEVVNAARRNVLAAKTQAKVKPNRTQGVSLRSAAEVVASRGEGTIVEALRQLRRFSHKFEATGFAWKPKNKPLYSVKTMAELIVKSGYADSVKTAMPNLKTKLEDCRDS